MSQRSQINDKQVAVIGAGTMGAGIAQKYASSGYQVCLVDRNEACLLSAQATIKATLEQGVVRHLFSEQEAKFIYERIQFSNKLSDVATCSLIIEAIFEDYLAKKILFQELEGIAGQEAIMATNTSSLSVTELQNSLRYPERFLGLHYFFHPAKNRLVEVIATKKTSPDVIAQACRMQENIKKIIIKSKDAPGFIVNRFFVPWLNEAVRMVSQKKATIATIEYAAKSFFKVPMGPFELMNVTGIPITMHAANAMAAKLGEFYAPCPLIGAQVLRSQKWEFGGEVEHSLLSSIAESLLGVVSAISCALVFDEEVGTASDVDLGARVGLLWPAGPFELINQNLQSLDKNLEGVARSSAVAVPKILKEHCVSRQPFLNPSIEVSRDKDIAVIKLNRPDSMNALDLRLKDELSQVFAQLEEDPMVKAIIVTGHQRAFMAGADLGFFNQKIAAKQIHEIVAFAASAQELFLRIDRSPKVVVAAISGLALGGGLELALCCDKIIATIDAKIGFPETGIGIYPGLGGTQRTPIRVGPELARYLVLTGTLLSGTEAKVIGLIDECSNSEDLLDDAKCMARNLLNNRHGKENMSTDAFKDLRQAFRAPFESNKIDNASSERAKKALERVSKKAPLAVLAADYLISKAHKASLEEGLELEIAGLTRIFQSEDAKLGLKGAAEKQSVKFSGR